MYSYLTAAGLEPDALLLLRVLKRKAAQHDRPGPNWPQHRSQVQRELHPSDH